MKTLFILSVFLSISGCRPLSEALDPDKNNQSQQNLPTVKREQPNVSAETQKPAVDPDSDDLIEVSQVPKELTDKNSNTATTANNDFSTPNNSSNTNENTNSSQQVSTGNYVVTFNSFGNVKVGMTVPEASKALGAELIRGEGYEDACYYVESKSVKGVLFMVTNNRIARIDIDGKDYVTDKGAKIGDSEEKIKSLYPRISVNPNKYDESRHDMETYSSDEKYLIIFETDGNRVTGFRVGNSEEVSFVEGCS